jgi:hypothetical protein
MRRENIEATTTTGAKALKIFSLHAALKRRSSTVASGPGIFPGDSSTAIFLSTSGIGAPDRRLDMVFRFWR